MFSKDYLARVNEIADDDDLTRGDKLRKQMLAMLDEIMVDVLSRPIEQWADALDVLDMPRSAAAVYRQVPR